MHMNAQRRDQILPGIVTGLKEEMTFEICHWAGKVKKRGFHALQK